MPQKSTLNTQIYEEACERFLDCRSGDLDDAQRAALDTWLRASPEHMRAYLEIAAIWDEGEFLDPEGKFDRSALLADATATPSNVIELARSPPAEVTQTSPPMSTGHVDSVTPLSGPPGRDARRSRRYRLAVAAAASLVALVAAFLFLSLDRPRTYVTSIGEQRSLRLADGSTVELNSRSRIVVDYSASERRVELREGQALFHVAKNASRPFVVKIAGTLVRAVGTEFDIYQKPSGTVVTVVEGRVAILTDPVDAPAGPVPSGTADGTPAMAPSASRPTAQNQPGNVMVAAGEQLTVTPQAIQIADHPNVANATAWTQRRLVFESATLAEVADEFNRYNDKRLVVADRGLESFHVSGVFSSTDPASLIRFLHERPELQLVEMRDEIRIQKSDR